jgi:hypothetical protein
VASKSFQTTPHEQQQTKQPTTTQPTLWLLQRYYTTTQGCCVTMVPAYQGWLKTEKSKKRKKKKRHNNISTGRSNTEHLPYHVITSPYFWNTNLSFQLGRNKVQAQGLDLQGARLANFLQGARLGFHFSVTSTGLRGSREKEEEVQNLNMVPGHMLQLLPESVLMET